MCSSPPEVSTTAKTSPIKNFKHGWQNNTVANMETFYAREVVWRSNFLDNLNVSYKDIGLWRTPTLRFIIIIIIWNPSYPPYIPTIASNNLVLGYNSYRPHELLHHYLNWPLKAVFKIEVFNALQMQFGPSKYTSLKIALPNATPNWKWRHHLKSSIQCARHKNQQM
jgi:hypothetical protein